MGSKYINKMSQPHDEEFCLKQQEYLRQHRTIWQEHSAKDFASYESYKRAGILYVFPPFITARMGQKIGRRPQTQLCGDALNTLMNGFVIMHNHNQIIPLFSGDDIRANKKLQHFFISKNIPVLVGSAVYANNRISYQVAEHSSRYYGFAKKII